MRGARDAVRDTAIDALESKQSAAALGYFEDPFCAKLANGYHSVANDTRRGGSAPKRMPMINRGTWARVAAMDRLVDEFLSAPFPPSTKRSEGVGSQVLGQKRQIISLGAGLDSRFFRLKQRSIEHRTATRTSATKGNAIPPSPTSLTSL